MRTNHSRYGFSISLNVTNNVTWIFVALESDVTRKGKKYEEIPRSLELFSVHFFVYTFNLS